MPYQLDTPVLAVDREILHKVDAGNPQNLFSMWTVFSKCADSVQQGRRLEYICWRYWNRQTFCHENHQSLSSTTPPKEIPSSSIVSDLPQLSRSVDSAVDNEEAVEFTSESSPLDIHRPRILRQDSCSARNRSPRSESFEKLVVSILDQKESLKAPLDICMPSAPPKKEATLSLPLQRSGSTTTESSARSSEDASEVSHQASPETPSRTHSIVKGFSPSIMQISRTPAKISPDSIDAKPLLVPTRLLKKQAATFTVGASVSSSEQSNHKMRMPAKPRMFQLGSSNSSEEEASLKSSLRASRPGLLKKQASINNQVMLRTINNDAAIADDSDMDGDDVDESAIDEDDSEWEDSDEASGNPSIDEKAYFRRVPSVAQLPSRPSLLTLGLQANDRAKRLGNVASQSTSALHRPRPTHNGRPLAGSPNDSDENPLMMKGVKNPQLQRINEVPRTGALPINAMAIPAHHQAALSPRATRRHMLATELTDSLRRHMVWERQYKHSTANAVLKRRHTSHDLANLKQHPEPAYMSKAEDQNASSFNQFFSKDADSGYHAKGW